MEHGLSVASGGGRVAGKMLATMGGSVVVILAMVVGGIWKMGRKAIVSSCPIAYVGEGQRLHLSNVTGTLDIELGGPAADGWVRSSSLPPTWSPRGTKIIYQRYTTSQPSKQVVVLEPMRGQWRTDTSKPHGSLSGWSSDDSYLERFVGFRDAWTGSVLRDLSETGRGAKQISALPDGANAAYIAVEATKNGEVVGLFDKQLRMVRSVSESKEICVPRADARGEWAGWTSKRVSSAGYAGAVIEIKALKEASESPVRVLGEEFEEAVFCDWTENGDILANVSLEKSGGRPGVRVGPWCLVILDKQGKMLHKIPTDVPPMAGSGASWRKWGNR